jgi:Holliday junction resolvase RusA-like endonuclease
MKLVIPGIPISKTRPRFCSTRHKKWAYDPQTNREMKMVSHQILSEWNRLFDGGNREIVEEASRIAQAESFEVGFTFVFPICDRERKGVQNAKLWGWKPHTSKPDFDNLEKFYSDCAKGILWRDDALIHITHSAKFYGKVPRTEIEIMSNNSMILTKTSKKVLEIWDPDMVKDLLSDMRSFSSLSGRDLEMLETNPDLPSKEARLNELAHLLLNFSLKYHLPLQKIYKIIST